MIQVQNVTQVYSSNKGVFDLNFTVKQGEVFGYLGPNGSGKTTTIRHLLGFSNVDQGQVLIDGLNARADRHILQQRIGYLPGEIAFFEHMTGKQFLQFLSRLRGFQTAPRTQELVQLFQLETQFLIKKMSKGMKQKLAIVAAFMHDPDILILDEPTSGLDPLMQMVFLDLLVAEKHKGKTILMSSHIFEEVDRVCDRAAIIKDGKIIAIEDLTTLRSQVKDQLIVSFGSAVDGLMHEGIEVEEVAHLQYKISIQQNFSHVLATLAKYPVTSIRSASQSIEHKFLHYYQESSHE
jgi:ABC-2 type transport system ATP-binding protein